MDHAKTIFGPCNGHIWPTSTPRVTKALKFSRLSQLSTRDILIKSLFLGPCQDPVWTILGHFLVKLHFQASYPFKIFKTGSTSSCITWLKYKAQPQHVLVFTFFCFLFLHFHYVLAFIILLLAFHHDLLVLLRSLRLTHQYILEKHDMRFFYCQ